MNSKNLLSIFVRGTVIDAQLRADGTVSLAILQEKKQKTLWLCILKLIADALYLCADWIHPRKYPSPGLNVTQTLMTWPSVDSPIRHKIIAEKHPVFTANGDAHYDLSPAPALSIVMLPEEL